MLIRSQPLDMEFCNRIGLNNEDDESEYSEREIEVQFIGRMFDDIFEKDNDRIPLRTRLSWFQRSISDKLYNAKYSIRNYFKWRKTIRQLRPWEGFSGLIGVMITHLNDYIETEEKYGHSEKEYRKNKIATARETVEILERMKEPDDYLDIPRKKVDAHYPEYKGLVTKYKNGGSSYCGNFIQQGNGWVGKESGSDPRKGYFEFINGKFQLSESPDQNETNRLLTQLDQYHEDIINAYEQGNNNSDKDFERLGQLLKDNMYSWWD